MAFLASHRPSAASLTHSCEPQSSHDPYAGVRIAFLPLENVTAAVHRERELSGAEREQGQAGHRLVDQHVPRLLQV